MPTCTKYINLSFGYIFLPVLYELPSFTRKQDYSAVLQAVKDLLPQAPRVQRIVMDFEDAAWRAARDVMPEVERKGCAFHLAQAMFRQIQALPSSEIFNGRYSCTGISTMRAGTRVLSNSYVHVPCSMDPKWLCKLQGHRSNWDQCKVCVCMYIKCI